MVWSSMHQDGHYLGVFSRRYASSGQPLGAELQVNSYTVQYQRHPAVGFADDGSYVVAWSSAGQDGEHYGVCGQRFASTGVPFGGEFQLNGSTVHEQSLAALAVDHDGDFVAVWTQGDGSHSDVMARLFSSTGTPLGPELQVNLSTAQFQYGADVAMTADGGFLVLGGSRSPSSDRDALVQRFSSGGDPVGGPFVVSSAAATPSGPMRLGVDGDDDFAVVWEGSDESGLGVFARLFSSSGAPRGPELRVNTHALGYQSTPDLGVESDGDFVVTWDGKDASGYGVFARRFSSSGAALGRELQVNSWTENAQFYPALAVGDDGDFVVAWTVRAAGRAPRRRAHRRDGVHPLHAGSGDRAPGCAGRVAIGVARRTRSAPGSRAGATPPRRGPRSLLAATGRGTRRLRPRR